MDMHSLLVCKQEGSHQHQDETTLYSKVTSSASGARVDNWSRNHCIEIADPLRALVGKVTSSSSSHNFATSNTHVPVTTGPWIRSPRMITTSCNVIVISLTGT